MNADNNNHDRCINYIEFNVADMARSKAFFGAAFGWTFMDYGLDYCEFTDGRMKGGFDASAPVRSGGPLVVLYGDDLTEIQRAVEDAGGKIVKPILNFLAATAFISPIPTAMNWRFGAKISGGGPRR